MLCDPTSYTDRSLVLEQTSLEHGRLTLHHPATDIDLRFIVELLKIEAAQNWDVLPLLESFRTSFSCIAGSHTSQAFMVKLNDLPLFEVEVHEGRKHAGLRSDFQAKDGDYFVILLVGNFDQAAFPVYIDGLRLCLEYFFQFSEVKHLIIPLYEGLDEEQRFRLFTEAGITKFLEKEDWKQPDLFSVSRSAEKQQ